MKIESLSIDSYTDPKIAYRRFPTLMGWLIQPDKTSAKDDIKRSKKKLSEFDISVVNSMDRYELEI